MARAPISAAAICTRRRRGAGRLEVEPGSVTQQQEQPLAGQGDLVDHGQVDRQWQAGQQQQSTVGEVERPREDLFAVSPAIAIRRDGRADGDQFLAGLQMSSHRRVGKHLGQTAHAVLLAGLLGVALVPLQRARRSRVHRGVRRRAPQPTTTVAASCPQRTKPVVARRIGRTTDRGTESAVGVRCGVGGRRLHPGMPRTRRDGP